MLNSINFQDLADVAYGLGVSSADAEVRGFAYGVETLAAYLARDGKDPAPELLVLLTAVAHKAESRPDQRAGE